MRRRNFLRVAAGTLAAPAIAATARRRSEDYGPFGSVSVTNTKEAVVDDDGETAYLAVTDGFATVDVSDPERPEILAERRELLDDREDGPLRQIWDVTVEGDRLVVAGPANDVRGTAVEGFLLYDVSDPADPRRVAFHETEFPIHNATIEDDRVYLTGNDWDENPVVIVDVDDDPAEVGRWSLLDHDDDWESVYPRLRWLHDVHVRDGIAYLAYWNAGTWIVDVSDPSNPDYLGDLGGQPIEELADVPAEDRRSEMLELPGNHHYAVPNEDGSILGVSKEAWVLDPETADEDARPGHVELWDVEDPGAPRKLTTILPPETPDPTYDVAPPGGGVAHDGCHDCGAIGDGLWTTAHNFEIVGDRLYSSWYQGGVKIHDIGDPETPEELAWWRQPEDTSFWTAELATESFFVASSMGVNADGKGALYTFPNREGTQADPPTLVDEGPDDPKTPDPARNESADDEGSTETPAPPTESDAEAVAVGGGRTGFTIGAALVGLAAGAWKYAAWNRDE